MNPQEFSPPATGANGSCAVCGKATDDGGGIHAYHDGRRFALCCPMCLQMFGRARDRFAGGDRPQSRLEELMEQMTWKNSGH